MTAAPGWYQDPSGSPDLRWWDGQTWTSALTAAPSPAPAVTATATDGGYYATVDAAAFNSLAYSQPAPYAVNRPAFGTPPVYGQPYAGSSVGRRRWSARRVIGTTVIGAALVAGVLAAAASSVFRNEAAEAKQTAARTSIQLPESVAGFASIRSAATDATIGKLKELPIPGTVMGGLYGTAAQPRALVIIWKTTTVTSKLGQSLKALETGVEKGSGTHLTFHRAAAGPLGGRMECATLALENGPNTECVFGDSAALGLITLFGPNPGDSAVAKAIRSEVEIRR